MKNVIFALAALLLFPAIILGGEKEEAYLKETMIPLAQNFLQRIGQANNLTLGTNQVKSYKINYFNDRPGSTANMRLTNGYVFSYYAETNKTEVCSFHCNIKTYYGLENPPKEKIEALKALNVQNKLNKNSAAMLAVKYFKMLGHKEENFHSLDFYPPEISQGYWVSSPESPPANERRLPYYEIIWYRKDITKKELDDNDSRAKLTTVTIEVSGIDSSLISYSKGMLPIGSDF